MSVSKETHSDQPGHIDSLLTGFTDTAKPASGRWFLVSALVVLAMYHGGLLLAGSYSETYDAYIHMFMGDHYATDWFSTWDQRWYTGFTTVSYPPGTHMAIAAFGLLFGDLRLGFTVSMLLGLTLLTTGVYRFSRLWFGEQVAGLAALLCAVSSGVAETVHLFGQLPTIWSLGFLLHASWFIPGWILRGSKKHFLFTIILLGATTAGHHVTTLFGTIFFVGPIVVYCLLKSSRGTPSGTLAGPTKALVARRIANILDPTRRSVILGVSTIAVLATVVLPYWLWSARDPINQIAIPHGTRENFIENPNLGLIFFVIPWGLAILALPYALLRYTASGKWPLAASLGLLFVLGTGGTTPIPKLLLGGAFDILTLDRFTFWATIIVLPGMALGLLSLWQGTLAKAMSKVSGRSIGKPLTVLLATGLLATTIFASTLTQFRSFQPAEIDTQPIADFMSKDQHERWRYLTLGFGDQVAWLSTQTDATQVDGNYHSARRLPELTSTPIERLEGAKYSGVEGLGSLQQFLTVPEKYHLKFVFSNDRFYDPLLDNLGWINLGPLENGVYLWERADIEPLPGILPVNEIPNWQRVMWGIIPPLMSLLGLATLLLALVKPVHTGATRAGNVTGRLSRVLLSWAEPQIDTFASPSRHYWFQLSALRKKVSQLRPRKVLVSLVLLAFVVGPIVFLAKGTPQPTAAQVVSQYYEHLNFREFEEAYELLDEQDRPSYELWRLQTSRDGGLISSYSTLDKIETTTNNRTDKAVEVVGDIRYLTALNYIDVEQSHTMRLTSSGWRIASDSADSDVPTDQLVRKEAVDYFEQGRRQVTALTTDLADIQDRPKLKLTGVRLVNRDSDSPSIVGVVSNVDVDPADLTLTGVLTDSQGIQLGKYNAADLMLRTLNPGESTPFIVEFSDVAATATDSFDPTNWEPLEVSDELAEVELFAKAVVTTSRLDRTLNIRKAQISQTDPDDSAVLSGTLFNTGTNEALVPRILVTYLDSLGRPLATDSQYLDNSITPQRDADFEFELSDLSQLEVLDLQVNASVNGANLSVGSESVAPLIISHEGPGYSAIRLDISSYWGVE